MIDLDATCSDSTSSNGSTCLTEDTSDCNTTIKNIKNAWGLTTWSNNDSATNIISKFWGLTTWSNNDSAIRDSGRVEDSFRLRFNSISRVI